MGFVEMCPTRSYDGIGAPITVVFTVTDLELNERWATKGEIRHEKIILSSDVTELLPP